MGQPLLVPWAVPLDLAGPPSGKSDPVNTHPPQPPVYRMWPNPSVSSKSSKNCPSVPNWVPHHLSHVPILGLSSSQKVLFSHSLTSEGSFLRKYPHFTPVPLSQPPKASSLSSFTLHWEVPPLPLLQPASSLPPPSSRCHQQPSTNYHSNYHQDGSISRRNVL